jgi:Domain of unknown function (DUF6531)
MKPLALVIFLAFLVIGPFSHLSSAQCYGPNGGVQVCSPSASASTVLGDGSQIISASATLRIPAGYSGGAAFFSLSANNGSSIEYCSIGVADYGPYGFDCAVQVTGPANLLVTFYFNANNSGSTNGSGFVQVGVPGSAYSTFPITILGTGNSNPTEPPPSDPDASCTTGCNSASGSKPINFLNGDTWIPQTDYALPGLGGGLTLTRTRNSLWSLMNPPEQSGIFGDSWRSNFEERHSESWRRRDEVLERQWQRAFRRLQQSHRRLRPDRAPRRADYPRLRLEYISMDCHRAKRDEAHPQFRRLSHLYRGCERQYHHHQR